MNDERVLSPGSRILIALACTTSVVFLSLYLVYSPFGWDFTDEGFYFNSYKLSDAYPNVVTFFGFVYSLPYRLLGENIIALRIFNVISVFVAGIWSLNQAIAGSSSFGKYILNSSTRYALVCSLSGLSLLGLGKFTSPSYNHLALIGCFLVAGALLRIGPISNGNNSTHFSSGIPLVVGIVFASLAKPTTGIVLGMVLLIYALLSKRSIRVLILLSLVLSGFLAFAVAALFAGGISALLAKVMLGQHWHSIVDGGYDAIGLLKSIKEALFYPPFVPFVFILFLQERGVSFLCRASDSRRRVYGFISAVVLLTVFLVFLSPLVGTLSRTYVASLAGTWFFAMPFVFFIFALKATRVEVGSHLEFLPIRSIASASRILLILLIPFVFGFGTNTGIWGKALSASLIFVSVAAYLVAQLPFRSIRRALPGFLLCYLVGVVLVTPSHALFYLHPQLQPQPLFLNKSVTLVGRGSRLWLSSSVSNYIQSVRLALSDNGFVADTPVLDWSGQSPGLIYALQGRAVGQPWIAGGYKGSDLLARNVLAKIPCKDLHLAWLILEPEGPNGLNTSILQDFGIDVRNPFLYEKVIELDVPAGVGDDRIARRQVIYKPIKSPGSNLDCS